MIDERDIRIRFESLENKIEELERITNKNCMSISNIAKDQSDLKKIVNELSKRNEEIINITLSIKELALKMDGLTNEIKSYANKFDSIEHRIANLESASGKLALSVIKQVALVVGTAIITGIIGLVSQHIIK